MTDEQLSLCLEVTADTIKRLTDFMETLSQSIIALDKRLSEVERLLNVTREKEA